MAHTVPQKCFLSHAWTLLPRGSFGIVTIPSGCHSGILGKPLSAVATRDPTEEKDAPVISSGRIHPSPQRKSWSLLMVFWAPMASLGRTPSQGEVALKTHTQVPGSIDPATPWLGQQLDVGTAIPSLCEHRTRYSGTTLVCGSAPSTHPPGSASTSASLPSGSSKARGK